MTSWASYQVRSSVIWKKSIITLYMHLLLSASNWSNSPQNFKVVQAVRIDLPKVKENISFGPVLQISYITAMFVLASIKMSCRSQLPKRSRQTGIFCNWSWCKFWLWQLNRQNLVRRCSSFWKKSLKYLKIFAKRSQVSSNIVFI